jgi:MraZ protein
MFMGEYKPALDEKGRVAIPARMRKAFGEDAPIDKLIITYGFGKCLMAYRESDWADFVKNKLVRASESMQDGIRLMRFFVGGAFECELDKQGRIIIPAYLKEYAGIEKDITIIGLYNRVEIWGREQYDSQKPDNDALSTFGKDLGFLQ